MRSAIVVKVAGPVVWFTQSRSETGEHNRVLNDGSIVQYLMFPFGIRAAKLSSVSFFGSLFRCCDGFLILFPFGVGAHLLQEFCTGGRVEDGKRPCPFRGDEENGHGFEILAEAAVFVALCCTARLTPCVGCLLSLGLEAQHF